MLQFFALFGVILMAFILVYFYFYFKKGTNQIIYIIIASIDVWQSCFANFGCQIHFTLFCHKFTSVKIFALFWVKFFWITPCLCQKIVFFQVCQYLVPLSINFSLYFTFLNNCLLNLNRCC